MAAEVLRETRIAEEEIREGRFQRTMALVAAFSAIVSGYEAYAQHRRGAFSNWLMWTPAWLAAPMVASVIGAFFSKKVAVMVLPIASIVSLIDGIVGFVYHIRGIARMGGGFKVGQYNVVMGPPIFAPLLVTIVGILGLIASLLRREVWPWARAASLVASPALNVVLRRERSELVPEDIATRISHGQFQRIMALTAAFFAILSGGEAYFEHLRGSFNQRLMWMPVWVTPPMVIAAIGTYRSRVIGYTLLPAASAINFFVGLLGFFLHLRGIKRMPGGFTDYEFNTTLGPPMFAPLLFTAVGLLGMTASLLRRDEDNG